MQQTAHNSALRLLIKLLDRPFLFIILRSLKISLEILVKDEPWSDKGASQPAINTRASRDGFRGVRKWCTHPLNFEFNC